VSIEKCKLSCELCNCWAFRLLESDAPAEVKGKSSRKRARTNNNDEPQLKAVKISSLLHFIIAHHITKISV